MNKFTNYAKGALAAFALLCTAAFSQAQSLQLYNGSFYTPATGSEVVAYDFSKIIYTTAELSMKSNGMVGIVVYYSKSATANIPAGQVVAKLYVDGSQVGEYRLDSDFAINKTDFGSDPSAKNTLDPQDLHASLYINGSIVPAINYSIIHGSNVSIVTEAGYATIEQYFQNAIKTKSRTETFSFPASSVTFNYTLPQLASEFSVTPASGSTFSQKEGFSSAIFTYPCDIQRGVGTLSLTLHDPESGNDTELYTFAPTDGAISIDSRTNSIVTFTLPTTVNVPGVYTLSYPEGFFRSVTGTPLPAVAVNYTIKASEMYTLTPSMSSLVPSLAEVKITYPNVTSLQLVDYSGIELRKSDGTVVARVASASVSDEGNADLGYSITLTLDNEYKGADFETTTLYIPEGAWRFIGPTTGGTYEDNLEITSIEYTFGTLAPPSIDIAMADGNVYETGAIVKTEVLPSMTLTIPSYTIKGYIGTGYLRYTTLDIPNPVATLTDAAGNKIGEYRYTQTYTSKIDNSSPGDGKEITYPDQEIVAYLYDNNGNLITDPLTQINADAVILVTTKDLYKYSYQYYTRIIVVGNKKWGVHDVASDGSYPSSIAPSYIQYEMLTLDKPASIAPFENSILEKFGNFEITMPEGVEITWINPSARASLYRLDAGGNLVGEPLESYSCSVSATGTLLLSGNEVDPAIDNYGLVLPYKMFNTAEHGYSTRWIYPYKINRNWPTVAEGEENPYLPAVAHTTINKAKANSFNLSIPEDVDYGEITGVNSLSKAYLYLLDESGDRVGDPIMSYTPTLVSNASMAPGRRNAPAASASVKLVADSEVDLGHGDYELETSDNMFNTTRLAAVNTKSSYFFSVYTYHLIGYFNNWNAEDLSYQFTLDDNESSETYGKYVLRVADIEQFDLGQDHDMVDGGNFNPYTANVTIWDEYAQDYAEINIDGEYNPGFKIMVNDEFGETVAAYGVAEADAVFDLNDEEGSLTGVKELVCSADSHNIRLGNVDGKSVFNPQLDRPTFVLDPLEAGISTRSNRRAAPALPTIKVVNTGGVATGISILGADTAPAAIYTIDGIRLGSNVDLSTLPAGLYIVNGKKYIAK